MIRAASPDPPCSRLALVEVERLELGVPSEYLQESISRIAVRARADEHIRIGPLGRGARDDEPQMTVERGRTRNLQLAALASDEHELVGESTIVRVVVIERRQQFEYRFRKD